MNETGKGSDRSLLLIFGIIGPIITITMTLLDVFISPWYSWSTSALSDLGVHPDSYLFNGGLLIEAGANLIFALGLKYGGYARTSTAVLLAVSGISLGFVGIFNENYHLVHLSFALVYFILFPVAIIMFSSNRKIRGNYSRAVGYGSAVVGLIVIIVGILQDFAIFKTPLGLGFYELVEALLLLSWSVYTGAYYFLSSAATTVASEGVEEDL